MLERQMAEKNKILQIRVGSHLYGTNDENSDEDYSGVFIPSEEYIFGLKDINEVDLSVKSKDGVGRNTKDAIDLKLYNFRKFVKLALDNNPNIIEQLFVNNKNIVFINEYGRSLLDNKYLFVHKGLKQKFIGYSKSQLHKMRIKKEHYFDLKNALEYFRECVDKEPEFSKRLMDCFRDFQTSKNSHLNIHPPKFIIIKRGHCSIGDLNFQYSRAIKYVMKILQERFDKASNRKNLILNHGYDSKFALNLVRLLREGIDFLKYGEVTFPLPYAQELLDIKHGKWAMEEVITYADKLYKEVESLYDKTALPAHPNRELVEKFVIDTHRSYIL